MEKISKKHHKYVTINVFRGITYVHFRKYTVSNEGKFSPTKYGIALTPVQYLSLEFHAQNINKSLMNKDKSTKYHLGSSKYVECKTGKVDMRKWFLSNDRGFTSGNFGIKLNKAEWKNLQGLMSKIHSNIPGIETKQLCCHDANATERRNCLNCTPYQ